MKALDVCTSGSGGCNRCTPSAADPENNGALEEVLALHSGALCYSCVRQSMRLLRVLVSVFALRSNEDSCHVRKASDLGFRLR